MKLTENEISRLKSAFESSNDALEPFRQDRLKLVDMYAGPGFGRLADISERTPVNMMELYVNIYMQHLAARRPQTLCDSPRARYRALAADLEADVNETLERMAFERVCYAGTLDSLFGIGIFCTGLDIYGGESEYANEPGRVYVEAVDLDDWVHDMSARSWSANEMQWCGHRVRMRYEDVLNSPLFDIADENDIQRLDSPQDRNSDSETVEHLQRRGVANLDLFAPMTELFHMWLPREHMIAVFPVVDGLIHGDPIRETEWTGAPGGPYDILSHVMIPKNSMPQAPLSYVRDLDMLFNQLMTKEGRNALERKTIYVGPTGAIEDAQKIIEAEDGEYVALNNPQAAAQPVSYRGADQVSMVFGMQVRQLFSYVAGNLDQLGGLGAQTATVGQEELLSRASSERMKAMQKNTLSTIRSVVNKVAYYRYSDPLFKISSTRSIPGVQGVEIPIELSAESFAGVDWEDLKFDIEPFSMRDVSPAQQASSIMEIVRGIVLPLMPLLQAQGNGLDVEALLRRVAKLTNTKGLDDIITSFRAPSDSGEQGGGMGSHEATKSPVTRREEIRRSVPRSGSQQQDSAMMASLLGKPKQAAEMGRVGQVA